MEKTQYNKPATDILPVRFSTALCTSAGGSGGGNDLGGKGEGNDPWISGRAPMAL